MTAVILGTFRGTHGPDLWWEDADGEPQRIPLAVVSAINTAIHALEVAELDPCTWRHGCDLPATNTDLNDRLVCHTHTPREDD